MTEAGFDEAIYVDFAEEVWDLLHKLANLPVAAGMDIIHATFNDLNLSMAMITYFKVFSTIHSTLYVADHICSC